MTVKNREENSLIIDELKDYSYCERFWFRLFSENIYNSRCQKFYKRLTKKRQNMLLKILGILFIISGLIFVIKKY